VLAVEICAKFVIEKFHRNNKEWRAEIFRIAALRRFFSSKNEQAG
jgi:hypothetical protein